MTDLPVSVLPLLRRLGRRVAIGLFLEIWPKWAVGSLLVGGTVALAARLFFPAASDLLGWLWLAPVLAAIPSVIVCVRRAYRPSEIVALADSLSGGQGTLLTLMETQDREWASAPELQSLSHLAMPRLRPWRRLGLVAAAAAFLATALVLPQRVLTGNTILANDLVADIEAAVEELKEQELITPDEARQLEEEIERIRQDAQERLDASSWEASDASREKIAAGLGEKQDAADWARSSLDRFANASQGGTPPSEADAAELAEALGRLAQTGMLNDAPADLQQLLGGEDAVAGGNVRLPSDPRALRNLAASLSRFLGSRDMRFGELRRLGREAGRFDPSEFGEFNFDDSEQDGDPGTGGLNRGRGDAELTWGDETLLADRFKPLALPPGSIRSPDDWAPVAELPGAPQESPELSGPSSGRRFDATAGQAAWRRTLAPRHYSAVRKYFENTAPPTQ